MIAPTGCPFSGTRGYGFSVRFAWSTVPGAGAYHLHLQHAGSPLAALDVLVTDSSYAYRFCRSYVIDANVHDWRWTIAGVSDDLGTEGPWAPEGVFEFGPMVFPPQP